MLLRFAEFDNPLSGFDEQFYLYVGGRMTEGLLPYVDIWDRKPVGLFLIYALAAETGGYGVFAYHILAYIFVVATSATLYIIALNSGSVKTAYLVAFAYPVWLNLPGGAGGQAPVFYNFFVALSALVIIHIANEQTMSPKSISRQGGVAMLLMGCAMQIKYTSLFEGIYFGSFLTWIAWRNYGFAHLPKLCGIWILTALLPTMAVALYYWNIGYLDTFMFANFLSVVGRGDTLLSVLGQRLFVIFIILAPLLVMAMPGIRRVISNIPSAQIHHDIFLVGWLGSAILAVIIFGTYYPHYSLAILPAACAAIGLSAYTGKRWYYVSLGMVLIAAIAGQIARFEYRAEKGGWRTVNALVSAVGEPANCPFFYDPPPILYHIGKWCAPTRYIFPGHLNQAIEKNSIGISPIAETRRILLRNPDVIVLRKNLDNAGNFKTRTLVNAAIRQRYILTATVPQGNSDYQVFHLRPSFMPRPNLIVQGG